MYDVRSWLLSVVALLWFGCRQGSTQDDSMTLTAESERSHTASLSWTMPNQQPGDKLSLQRALDHVNPVFQTVAIVDAATGNAEADGLKPDTAYTFRLCTEANVCSPVARTRTSLGRLFVSSEAEDRVLLLQSGDRASPNSSVRAEAALYNIISDLGRVNSPHAVVIAAERNEVFVANTNRDEIVVYSNPIPDDMRPLRIIGGPESVLDSPISMAYDPGSRQIAVVQERAPHLLLFDADSTGDAAPLATKDLSDEDLHAAGVAFNDEGQLHVGLYGKIVQLDRQLTEVGNKTMMFRLPSALAFDHERDQLWMTDLVSNELVVFNQDDSGTLSKDRVISGSETQLDWPFGIAVDHKNEQVAVSNFGTNAILVFSTDAHSDAAPARILSGEHSRIAFPRGIAFDAERDEWLLADYGTDSFSTWQTSASGDVPPNRYIRDEVDGLTRPRGLYADVDRSELYIAAYGSDAIYVYELTNDAVAGEHKRVIVGDATSLAGPEGVVVDDEGLVYVANIISNAVTVYAPGASGDAEPIRIIKGDNTGLHWPYGIALDKQRSRVMVSNLKGSSVMGWPIDANGDVESVITIVNEDFMDAPQFMHYEPSLDQLFIADARGAAIAVFSFDDDGTPAFERGIKGSASQLNSPEGIYVDAEGGRIYVSDFRAGAVYAFDLHASGNTPPEAVYSVASIDSLRTPTGLTYIPD